MEDRTSGISHRLREGLEAFPAAVCVNKYTAALTNTHIENGVRDFSCPGGDRMAKQSSRQCAGKCCKFAFSKVLPLPELGMCQFCSWAKLCCGAEIQRRVSPNLCTHPPPPVFEIAEEI